MSTLCKYLLQSDNALLTLSVVVRLSDPHASQRALLMSGL